MANLIVLKFDTADGAETMVALLDQPQARPLIPIDDAAALFWPFGAPEPTMCRIHQLAGEDRLDGAFWSLLFGCLLSIPFSAAPDAAADLLGRAFSEFGIDRDFLELAHHRMIEGTSTLFLLSRHPISDRLNAIMRRTDLPYELITTQLSAEKAARLHQVFVAPALESPRLDPPPVADTGVRPV